MRKEKPLLLDEIKDKIDAANALIVTSYDKLEPNISWRFRELLGKTESQLEIVKKRVFLKAAEKSGVKIDEALLEGHIGVVFVKGSDAMISAKALVKFSEENGNLLKVIFGQIDGKQMPGEEVVMLSKLPGIEEMRATLLGLLVSTMSHTLSVMEAAIAGPLSTLEKQSES